MSDLDSKLSNSEDNISLIDFNKSFSFVQESNINKSNSESRLVPEKNSFFQNNIKIFPNNNNFFENNPNNEDKNDNNKIIINNNCFKNDFQQKSINFIPMEPFFKKSLISPYPICQNNQLNSINLGPINNINNYDLPKFNPIVHYNNFNPIFYNNLAYGGDNNKIFPFFENNLNNIFDNNKNKINKKNNKKINKKNETKKNKEKKSPIKFLKTENIIKIELLESGEEKRTCVRLFPIPHKYSPFDIIRLIDKYLKTIPGKRIYRSVYVPLIKLIGKNIGYCFVDLVSPKYVIEFYKVFNGLLLKKCKKPCSVIFSDKQNSDNINENPLREPIFFKDIIKDE